MKKEKTIIVTGSTSGIGKETVTALLKEGHRLVLPVRNRQKAVQCLEYWSEKAGNTNVHIMDCDLASLQSVRDFSAEYRKQFSQTDILINNAGIWDMKRKESKDGIERMFAVNHLSHFLLTGFILPTIPKGGRIINVASDAYKSAILDFDDIENKKSFNGIRVYRQSKLCSMLFTLLLAKKLHTRKISVNSLDPGFVSTAMFRNIPTIIRKVISLFMIDSVKGAETTIYLATSDEVENLTGQYFMYKKPQKTAANALDEDVAVKLWQISEEYTGITY